MAGTAGLPHVIVRFFTVPRVKDARVSAGWALLFISILYTTAPAVAVFARTNLINTLSNTSYEDVPDWFTNWEKTGLLKFEDKNNDGIIQYGPGNALENTKPIFSNKRGENGERLVINNLSKVYDNGFNALKNINLNIKKGEIFAMLGPNGAGKTTLISIICGIVKPSSGKITVEDFDIIEDYRETRSRIGLVPQELTLEQFETVFNNVSYSRGLYGKKPDPKHIEKVLRQLSLWDKKDLILRQLSGGMKRRVLIAKALSHEPQILFLDEPTAGVDVELRKEMWRLLKL